MHTNTALKKQITHILFITATALFLLFTFLLSYSVANLVSSHFSRAQNQTTAMLSTELNLTVVYQDLLPSDLSEFDNFTSPELGILLPFADKLILETHTVVSPLAGENAGEITQQLTERLEIFAHLPNRDAPVLIFSGSNLLSEIFSSHSHDSVLTSEFDLQAHLNFYNTFVTHHLQMANEFVAPNEQPYNPVFSATLFLESELSAELFNEWTSVQDGYRISLDGLVSEISPLDVQSMALIQPTPAKNHFTYLIFGVGFTLLFAVYFFSKRKIYDTPDKGQEVEALIRRYRAHILLLPTKMDAGGLLTRKLSTFDDLLTLALRQDKPILCYKTEHYATFYLALDSFLYKYYVDFRQFSQGAEEVPAKVEIAATEEQTETQIAQKRKRKRTRKKKPLI